MTGQTLWIDAVCPTFPAHLRERFTLPLLGHPAAPSLASPDACAAQALIARLQGFGRRDAAGPATAVAYPADPHKSGTGLGSRWHALLQALEWAALQRDSRVVLSEVGEKGVPYLARRGCAVSSERCFFQDLDTCDSFAACSATRVVGTVGWGFPQNVTRQRMGAWWKVWQSATVWEAPVPPVFKGRRSLLWWQSQLALFALQPAPFTLAMLDAEWVRGRGRTGNKPARRRRYRSWEELHPYVSMHVRWGDKCWKEATCRSARDYAKAAESLRRQFGVSRLALSSEDPEAISLIPEVLGDDWEVYWSAGKRFGQGLKANLPAFDAGKAAADLAAHSKPQSSLRWPGESPRLQAQPPGELGEAEAGPSEATRQLAALNVSSQSVVNLLVSAAADYIVCTASSNWCRVVVKLGCALQGRCPRAVFMDEWEWDFTMQGRTAMREPSFRSFSQIQLRGGDPDLFFRDPW
ncbi:hypothetical protein EMIHUDRAFT_106528 [Emiliania huxleyi CCMP1516]|uniref:Uncharacterized protein n=2 Tax=Emiliania huxleyi TaxID=2903 RepID=A0A0D3I8A1_EMIH1|nr:hypothetical protein EMIHUDRAFT_106528 [Emiliania huxleyi CCMP1516]EOD07486.1 hypothetical protein EMIHUDRAFT_106528 [Emiliania huxleyi CCMP1516]|eukprot:XP_005759915.1 hypothetical protein EMIHUDRAFT_106528 [Emiliania huxleyi CCMP1516]